MSEGWEGGEGEDGSGSVQTPRKPAERERGISPSTRMDCPVWTVRNLSRRGRRRKTKTTGTASWLGAGEEEWEGPAEVDLRLLR